MSEAILLTQEEYNKLEAERDQLVVVKRKEVSERLKEAISYGDLKENSEYDAAKNEQAEVEERIQKLENMIRAAKIINDKEVGCDTVNIGLMVTVKDLSDGEEDQYVIVGAVGADPLAEPARISYESAIGKSLFGKKVGDVAEVTVPDGIIQYEIIDIVKA